MLDFWHQPLKQNVKDNQKIEKQKDKRVIFGKSNKADLRLFYDCFF